MKAIVHARYGPPEILRWQEAPRPQPGVREILVKVRAASVNPLDWHFMRGSPFPLRAFTGLARPRTPILGADFSGQVEAVGAGVIRFKVGDEVFGSVLSGAFADYLSASEDRVAPKPGALGFEEAAALPIAGITALQGLRDHGALQPGQRLLIEGASGGVGSFAIQLGKWLGAHVTAVCSAGKIDLARQLGADTVIDYAREDFARGNRQYHLIFSTCACHSVFQYRRSLLSGGRYVMAGGKPAAGFQAFALGRLLSRSGGRKLGGMMAKTVRSDLELLAELVTTGKMRVVIDRRYPLSHAAEAIRYLEEGHARGKVVLTVE